MLNAVDTAHSILGTWTMEKISQGLYKLSGNKIPLWNKYMPKGADQIDVNYSNGQSDLKVVYFPSCINRTMGLSKESDENVSLTVKTEQLLRKAGYEIIYPSNLNNLCCGMAFASKGFKLQGDKKSDELKDELLKASADGLYPILFDMSPCLYRMKEFLSAQNNSGNLKVYEPVEFIHEFLTDKLLFHKIPETIAIHSTCSSIKMGLTDKLKQVAELCAEIVILPNEVGCCGWAGDRGFTYPELNASALKNLKKEIPDNCSKGYSTSRTCEIGLSLHSGINYESIIYLVDKCTEKKELTSVHS